MNPRPVDEVAVQRAVDGDTVVLNRDERITAVHRLYDEGLSDSQVGERLGIATRQAQRDKHSPRPESLGGGPPMPGMPPDGELLRIRLDEIDPHPSNIREDVGDGVDDLAASIREVGLLQPLIVSRKPDSRYLLIAGHRRHAAMLLIPRLRTAMCVVRPETTATQTVELMLVENLQRRSLNPIEEANAYQALVNMGMTQHQIGDRVGISHMTVTNRLALLDLPANMQREIVNKSLGVTDGYRLAVEIRQAQRDTPLGRPKQRGPNSKPSRRFYASSVPNFNGGNPLAPTAAAMCLQHGHPRNVRIGPACGPCWEQTIRDDERARVLGQEAAS